MANLLRSYGCQTVPDRLQHHLLRPTFQCRRPPGKRHGERFQPISAQCQVIIADGLKGTDYREIPIDGLYCKAPKIGAAIADADIVISMTHFKGHEQAGFGGALKNLGMGAAAVPGKLELHASAQPKIETDNCIGCNICVKHCVLMMPYT